MRKLVLLLCLIFAFCLVVNNAEAKRFGGGKNFGVQRTTNFSRIQSIQSPNKISNTSKWFSPLIGLATGGLLAYLFMGHGIGSGVLSWLVVSIVLMLLLNLIRNLLRPAIPLVSRNQNIFGNAQQNFMSS